jgi:DNA-binding CsgD family transcriptional regulator
MLHAHRGRPVDTAPYGTAADHAHLERDDGYAWQVGSWANGIFFNGLSRYDDACAALREAAFELTYVAPRALSELIEAAHLCGDARLARDALARFQTWTVAGSDWAAGLEARARAFLSDGDESERWYVESIACLARTPQRFDLTRSHLVYGEWLRHQSRQVDARHHLHIAHDRFVAMGTAGFAERARRELLATGGKARKREADTQHVLTPQEHHIARLARDGRTNAQISAELFLSVRTVEWHLGKVFSKLGITSRRGLESALSAPGQTPTAALHLADL